MAVRHGYGKVVTDGLVFAYDTGDTKNSYLGAPMFNASREIHNWPTKARATVTEYTSGDIEPPFPGAKISKAVCTSTTSGILLRDGSYYYGGGFAGTGNPQNTDLLSDRTNSYTPVGDNKFTFVVYAKAGPDTDDNTTVSIDIGDRNVVNVTNLENYDDWVRLETDDSGGIGSQYPYDFFDIVFSNSSIGNTIYLSAPMIIRTLGTDSGSLGTPPANIQYLPPKASRSVSGSLLDLTGTRSLDVTNVSFDDNAQPTFNGSNNRIYIGQDLGLQNTSFSAEALVYWDGDSTDTFFGYYDTVTSGTQRSIHWRIYNTGQVRFDFYANSINSATGAIVANTWYHLLVTYDSTSDSCKCYRNGELLMQGSAGPYLGNDSDSKGYVGAWTPSSQPFGGEVPIFKLYNRALTEGEVKQNFAMYKKRFNI